MTETASGVDIGELHRRETDAPLDAEDTAPPAPPRRGSRLVSEDRPDHASEPRDDGPSDAPADHAADDRRGDAPAGEDNTSDSRSPGDRAADDPTPRSPESPDHDPLADAADPRPETRSDGSEDGPDRHGAPRPPNADRDPEGEPAAGGPDRRPPETEPPGDIPGPGDDPAGSDGRDTPGTDDPAPESDVPGARPADDAPADASARPAADRDAPPTDARPDLAADPDTAVPDTLEPDTARTAGVLDAEPERPVTGAPRTGDSDPVRREPRPVDAPPQARATIGPALIPDLADLPATPDVPGTPPLPEPPMGAPAIHDRAGPDPATGDADSAPGRATHPESIRVERPPVAEQPHDGVRDGPPREHRDGRDAPRHDGPEASAPGPDRSGPGAAPAPPPEVNYRRDGLSRKDAYLDAAKRTDATLRVGAPPQSFEHDLIDAYGARLTDQVQPAVHREVAELAAACDTAATHRVGGLDAAGLRTRLHDDTASARPDLQVGDITDAVHARIRVARPEQLGALLDTVERRLGTGDRGRILEIRRAPDGRAEIPITVGIEVDGHPHTYELHLTSENE